MGNCLADHLAILTNARGLDHSNTLIFPRHSIATHLQNGLQGLKRARSSVRIERWSPEPKVRGSNPLGRIEKLTGYGHTRLLDGRLVLVLCRFYFFRIETILRSAGCAAR